MLSVCSIDQFENNKFDAIFAYGAGRKITYFEYIFREKEFIKRRLCGLIDADTKKHGTYVEIWGKRYPVYGRWILDYYKNKNIAIIILCNAVEKIIEQINENHNSATVYYVDFFEMMELEKKALEKDIPVNLKKSKIQLIPKTIHYAWFGGNPIPDKYKKWMESWSKYCPDYEIKRWDENNYDITKNKYMLQAYEQKKWGFVPDYARLDIIYNYGGIYLDTDVEIIKNLDELLYQKAFAGYETEKYVNLGSGFGAQKKMPIIKEMLDYYEDKEFVNSDGLLNLIASPRLQTEVLRTHGLKQNGEYQIVDGMTIFPEKMFSGKNERMRKISTKDYSVSIHHYDASWVPDDEKFITNTREKLLKNAIIQEGGLHF